MTERRASARLSQPQLLLFADDPSAALKPDVVRHAVDDLFNLARHYTTSQEYHEFLKFVTRFRFYSPYNAMLIHCQMSGATFVAPPHRWLRQYGRHVRLGARAIVILQPMGPVMFVFDVSDTEPEPGAPDLPKEVTEPLEVHRGRVGAQLKTTIENAKRDCVAVNQGDAGSQQAGMIGLSNVQEPLRIEAPKAPHGYVTVLQRYELLLNAQHSREAQYATLVHELAHLYCGHLGTPNERWWPDRRRLTRGACEFEAESVSYLVCQRLGIDTPAVEYLSGYLGANEAVPAISLDCVLKTAGLIERMGRSGLPPRQEKDTKQ